MKLSEDQIKRNAQDWFLAHAAKAESDYLHHRKSGLSKSDREAVATEIHNLFLGAGRAMGLKVWQGLIFDPAILAERRKPYVNIHSWSFFEAMDINAYSDKPILIFLDLTRYGQAGRLEKENYFVQLFHGCGHLTMKRKPLNQYSPDEIQRLYEYMDTLTLFQAEPAQAAEIHPDSECALFFIPCTGLDHENARVLESYYSLKLGEVLTTLWDCQSWIFKMDDYYKFDRSQ